MPKEQERIKVVEPVMGREELRNASEVIMTNWLSWRGEYVKKFQQGFASYVGMKHGIATTSCTTALHLALATLGIGSGDNVIVPAFTFIATANAVHYTGAEPRFVDSDKDYWCINAEKIEEKIDKNTKAILIVHIFGHPCDMDRIMAIAKKHGLYVVEDCAQGVGSEYKGRKAGTFGIISCFSFDTTKYITTGEGGMCLTNSAKLEKRMRILMNLGFNLDKPVWEWFKHEHIGFNYRMTNLQAAVGVAQLKRLDWIVNKKRWIASRYRKLFEGSEGIQFANEMPWAKSSYWCSTITVRKKARNMLIRELAKNGVETRPFYHSLNLLPMYKTRYRCQVSENLGYTGFTLPSVGRMKEKHIRRVVSLVKEINESI